MSDDAPNAHGLAAFSLLEAIILTLIDKGVLTEDELDDACSAAIDAHRNRPIGPSAAPNTNAAEILERFRVNGNSVMLDGNQRV